MLIRVPQGMLRQQDMFKLLLAKVGSQAGTVGGCAASHNAVGVSEQLWK